MTTNTMDRINQLSTERTKLFVSAGRRSDPALLERIHQIEGELASLWEARRQERAGRRDGIDLFIDRAYEHTYGRGYEEVVSPTAVAEEKDAVALAA
jgi:hypothetical protein